MQIELVRIKLFIKLLIELFIEILTEILKVKAFLVIYCLGFSIN